MHTSTESVINQPMAEPFEQVELGVAYRNVPPVAKRSMDIGQDRLTQQIQQGKFRNRPLLEDHQEAKRIGRTIDASLLSTQHSGTCLMIEYAVDTRTDYGAKVAQQIRSGELPQVSLGHNMETGEVVELSIVTQGYRPGTQRIGMPKPVDQTVIFRASKIEALAQLAKDGNHSFWIYNKIRRG